MFANNPPRISNLLNYTAVACSDAKTAIDIFTLFRIIKIDEVHDGNEFIVGVKLNNESRGMIKGNKSFYNQISLVLHHHGRYLNIKIFLNGKIHISGARSDLTVEYIVLRKLFKYLNKLNGSYSCNYTTDKGLMTDPDSGFIFGMTHSGYKRIGHFEYVTKKDKFTGETNVNKVYKWANRPITFDDSPGYMLKLIQTDEKYKMVILNDLLQPIGKQYLYLINNRKNTPKKGTYTQDTDGNLFNKNGEPIGKYERKYSGLYKQLPNNPIEVKFNICKQQINIDDIQIELANNNNKFEIELGDQYFVHREKFEWVLKTYYNISSNVEPERYHGSNTKLYFNAYKDGLCHCYKNISKCICLRISLHVFATGSVLIMGSRLPEHAAWVYNFFTEIVEKHYQEFILPKVDLDEMIDELDVSDNEIDFFALFGFDNKNKNELLF